MNSRDGKGRFWRQAGPQVISSRPMQIAPFEEVRFEYGDDGAVLNVVLNRPSKRNAISPAMATATQAALEEAIGRGVRLVVVRSAAEGVFCAGFDIAHLDSSSSDPSLPLYRLYDCLERLPAVTLAFVDGIALGGGVELLASCDLRLATSRSRFTMPPAKLSVVYEREGIARFIRRAGLTATSEMFLTGRSLTAVEAERCGLVTRVVSSETVADYCTQILKGAPLAQRAMKEIIAGLSAVENCGISDERFDELKRTVLQSRDREEALNAFRQKRSPRFSGH
jgi:enoyl-CoA hydratase